MGYEGYKDTWHTMICGYRGYNNIMWDTWDDTWDTRIYGIRGYMGHEDTWDVWDTKMQDIGIQGDRDMGIHLMGYEDTPHGIRDMS